MASNKEAVVVCVEKKCLRRLFTIASDPKGSAGLVEKNHLIEPTQADELYLLALECFEEWAGIGSRYLHYYDSLCRMNRRFSTLKGEEVTPQASSLQNTQVSFPIKHIVNQRGQRGSLAQKDSLGGAGEQDPLRLVVQARQRMVELMVSASSTDMRLSFYSNAATLYLEAARDLHSQARVDASLRERATAEIAFYEQIADCLQQPLGRADEKIKFLYRLRQVSEEVFGDCLDIDARVRQLLNRSIADDISLVLKQRLSMSRSFERLLPPPSAPKSPKPPKNRSPNFKIAFAVSNPPSAIASPATSQPRRMNATPPPPSLSFIRLEETHNKPILSPLSKSARPLSPHKQRASPANKENISSAEKNRNAFSPTRPCSNLTQYSCADESTLSIVGTAGRRRRCISMAKGEYSFRAQTSFTASERSHLSAAAPGSSEGLHFLNHIYRDIDHSLNRHRPR